MRYYRIKNERELSEEKGIYYTHIMQIMGAPVKHGVLIPVTDMKYFYNELIEGVFQTLTNIAYAHKNENGETIIDHKVFPTISRREFKHSMTWALADLFCDGCDIEDWDKEEAFKFFDREERYELHPDDRWNSEWGTRKKYADILTD